MKRAEYTSDKIKEPHTLSISLRDPRFHFRIALMHTDSP
jgi:hypothetical protein